MREAWLTAGRLQPTVTRGVALLNALVLIAGVAVAGSRALGHQSVGLKVRAMAPGSVSFAPDPPTPAVVDTHAAVASPPVASGSSASWHPGPAAYAPAAPRPPDPPVPTSTTLAQPEGTIPTYTDVGGVPNGTIGKWYGYQLVLPVTMIKGDWLQVRRPERPNGSVTWIRAADAFVSTTPYYMTIDVGPEILRVFNAGQQILAFPVGVGKPNTPTPSGNFFIAVHEPSSGYEYGPLILDTSAHSEVIRDWDGRGDAVIAIHGPIDSYADSRIGSGNARVSNGCIRMHNSDLSQLSNIPLGTPLDIYP